MGNFWGFKRPKKIWHKGKVYFLPHIGDIWGYLYLEVVGKGKTNPHFWGLQEEKEVSLGTLLLGIKDVFSPP